MTATKRDEALDVMHALVLEDGRRWGDAATDFQREDARAVLDPDSPAPYNLLTRGRGGSKTADGAGMGVAAMLTQLDQRSRLYALAADLEQGRLLVDSISGFAARTPELADALRIDSYRVTATRSGSVLDVLPADQAGIWGIRPALLLADELGQWATTAAPRRLWEAAASAVAKVAGARMVVLTTASDPAHWSRRVLEFALTDPLWRVNEVPGPVPWLDPQRVGEQRRRLPESSFRRLFLNEWVASEDRLVDIDDLRACVRLEGPLPPAGGTRYVLGLDVGVRHDRTAVAVCHAEPVITEDDQGERGIRVTLDRLRVWAGRGKEAEVQLDEVSEFVDWASSTYNGGEVVFDPSQAILLAQQLRRRGVRMREFAFTPRSISEMALTLHGLVRSRALVLPDDEELLDELANVRLRETSPGTFRVDHDPSRHDDRVVAVGLAAQRLVERGHRVGIVSSHSPNRTGRRIPTQLDRGATYAERVAAARAVGVDGQADAALAVRLRVLPDPGVWRP